VVAAAVAWAARDILVACLLAKTGLIGRGAVVVVEHSGRSTAREVEVGCRGVQATGAVKTVTVASVGDDGGSSRVVGCEAAKRRCEMKGWNSVDWRGRLRCSVRSTRVVAAGRRGGPATVVAVGPTRWHRGEASVVDVVVG
jgi:hypothetical protein